MISLILLLFRIKNNNDISQKSFWADPGYKDCEKQNGVIAPNEIFIGGQNGVPQYPHNEHFVYCMKNENNYLEIRSCTFSNLIGEKKAAKDDFHQLFNIKSVNFLMIDNSISDCTTYDEFITCTEPNNDAYFKMYSNTIKNCHHQKNERQNTIITKYYYNDIQNNTISYESISKSGRAFEIWHHKGCIFIGNQVTNSFHKDSSGVKFQEDNDENINRSPLIVADCIFSNCQGDNDSNQKNGGLGFLLEYFNYDINILNVTFKNFKPYEKGKDLSKAYYIRIDPNMNNNPNVTFSSCTFDYLESDAQSRGGIGFIYRKTGQKFITFDNCKFMNLKSNHNSIGGGALCFDNSVNEMNQVFLTVFECSFEKISSKGSGGAISFNSDSGQLTVIKSNFTETSIENDVNNFGGAIYTNFQENNQPVFIKNCIFTNTNSFKGGSIYINCFEESKSQITIDECTFTNTIARDNGHSIYIYQSSSDTVTISCCDFVNCGENQISYTIFFDVSTLIFENNKILFTDSDKNCGCIQLNKIYDHSFIGNTFTNSFMNTEKNYDLTWRSAGITCDAWIAANSLTIENNVFDHILGNNQGRCFYVAVHGVDTEIKIKNNTVQNCPPGGTLVKVWLRDGKSEIIFESFHFINNIMKDVYDSSLGCTPQLWIENLREGDNEQINPIELIFKDCEFVNNSCLTQGGALQFGPNRFIANCKINLQNCRFQNNSAENNGGALFIQTYQGIECIDCTFNENKAKNGGVIYIQTDFQCKNPDADGFLQIPSEESRTPVIKFLKCNFEGNNGNDVHGIQIKESIKATLQIAECYFYDCGSSGCVISIQSKVEDNEIKNCTIKYIDENKSSSGILSVTDKIKIIGNTFQKCNKNTIQIEGQINENNEIHLIENSFIECNLGSIINVVNAFTQKPVFRGNVFQNLSLKVPLFEFKLLSSIESFDFDNNTFYNCNMNTNKGGLGMEISNEDTSNILHLTYTNCVFVNNKNLNNKQNGGAIHFGTFQNNGNINLLLKGCHFYNNENDEKGGSLYINVINDVSIEECVFNDNSAACGGSIFILPDYNDNSQQSSIKISKCVFQKNKAIDKSSIYVESGSTKSFLIDFCSFENENSGLMINNVKNMIKVNNDEFIKTSQESALTIVQTEDIQNEIYVDRCIFDSCYGKQNKCFDFTIYTQKFNFINSIMQNMIGTGESDYFGTFNFHSYITVFLNNISFVNNCGNSLYGGGISIQFLGIPQLNFRNCKFINNTSLQKTDISRPKQESDKNYYNGDGGGIQLGYGCTMNNMNVQFDECTFQNNKAQRHGAAIAIQTHTIVTINKCIFENNIANFDDTPNLLFDNHFDKKTEGRGGAIYINPAYSYNDNLGECDSPTLHMTNINILKCQFISNKAYDGYAIYIEGDDPGTRFEINSNDFTDNYNEKNHNDDEHLIYGAVITTEICRLLDEGIIENNNFIITDDKVIVNKISCVDHYGKTPTKGFSKSDEFTQSNLFSSHYFSESFEFSESIRFSNSNVFSQSEKFKQTDKFSPSDDFTHSNEFTGSYAFSNSAQFSKSDVFDKTKEFSSSCVFSVSNTLKTKYVENIESNEIPYTSNSISNDVTITNTNDVTATNTNDVTITNTNDVTITNTNDVTVTNTNDVTITNTNDVDVTNTNDVGLTNTNDVDSSATKNNNAIITSNNYYTNNSDNIDISQSNEKEIETNSKSKMPLETNVSSSERKTKSNSMPLIIGVVIGCIVLIAIIIIIIIFVVKRKRNNHNVEEEQDGTEFSATCNEEISEFVNPLCKGELMMLNDPFQESFDESKI